jgi:hypothetical protein
LFPTGIDLAPFGDGMFINGISIFGEILLNSETVGTSVAEDAQGNNFYALLFLTLAAPAPNNPLLTKAAESSLAPASEEVCASAGALSSPRAGIVSPDKLFINPSPSDADGTANAVNEVYQEKLHGTACTSDRNLWQRIPAKLGPGLRNIVKIPSLNHPGEDEEAIAISVSQDQWAWFKNLLVVANSLDKTASAKPEGASATLPRKLFSTGSLQISLDSMHLRTENSSQELAQIAIETGTEETRHILTIAPSQSDPFLRSDSVGPEETADRMIFQRAREPERFDELHKRTWHSIDADSDLRQLIVSVGAEEAPPRDSGWRFIQQTRSNGEGELNTSFVSETIENLGKIHAYDDQQPEQGFSFQRKDSEMSSEPFQTVTESPVEIAPRNAVLFQVGQARDKATATAAREPQKIDWRPVIDRVVVEVSGRIRIGEQEAVLQLDPPELGKLKIDLFLDGDKLAARILTETQESRLLIETHLPELRQALEENRVELVDVRIDSGSWNGPRGEGQQEPRQEPHGGHQTAYTLNDPPHGDSEERELVRRSSTVIEAGRVSMWA